MPGVKAKRRPKGAFLRRLPHPPKITDAELDARGAAFSALLLRLRLAENWTRTDLAERTGLTPQAVRLLETGQRAPGFETLIRLEHAFRRSLEWLARQMRRLRG